MTGLAEKALARYVPPTRKDEAFRYVQLRGLDLEPSLGKFEIEGEALAMSLDLAFKTFGAQLQVRQENWLASEKDPFALFNRAHSKEGMFIYVAPKNAERAVLRHIGNDEMVLPRLIVHVGKGASLHLTLEQSGEMANRFCDFLVEENAQLTVHFTGLAKKQIDTIRVTCHKNAHFKSVNIQQETPFQRQSYEVSLDGENAYAELLGVSQKCEQAHTHVLIKHCAEHTRSSQKFKAVVDSKERSSFEGKIFVESHAQKTEAYQLSQALLLASDAKAYSKPNLEIFADDVKASHGATVGQINPEEIFYLQARGIPRKEAEKLLIEGFVQEILNEVS